MTGGVSKHSVISGNGQWPLLAKTREEKTNKWPKKEEQNKRGASVSHQGIVSIGFFFVSSHWFQRHTGSYREKARELHRFKQWLQKTELFSGRIVKRMLKNTSWPAVITPALKTASSTSFFLQIYEDQKFDVLKTLPILGAETDKLK